MQNIFKKKARESDIISLEVDKLSSMKPVNQKGPHFEDIYLKTRRCAAKKKLLGKINRQIIASRLSSHELEIKSKNLDIIIFESITSEFEKRINEVK